MEGNTEESCRKPPLVVMERYVFDLNETKREPSNSKICERQEHPRPQRPAAQQDKTARPCGTAPPKAHNAECSNRFLYLKMNALKP